MFTLYMFQAMETEKMMGHVRDIDRNFMMKIEYLDDIQGDASS